jgi:hypothetical protein
VSLVETVSGAAAFDSRQIASVQMATQMNFLRKISRSAGLKGKKMGGKSSVHEPETPHSSTVS